mgnify:CR=1 FL=1
MVQIHCNISAFKFSIIFLQGDIMRKIVIALILLMVFELYANRDTIYRFSDHNENETIIEKFEDNINYDTSSTIPSYSFGEYLVE